MPSLKEVKNRIQSVRSTQQITKAMKMVAAAKLRKAQDRIIQLRPYSQKQIEILKRVTVGTEEEVAMDYASERPVETVLLIAITSDRGLAGAFNSNIFRTTRQLLEGRYRSHYERGDLTIMPIGKKSIEFFKKRKFKVIEDYADLFTRLSFDNVKWAAEHVMEDFVAGRFDKVEIIYNEFKNVATQVIRVEQFLPIPREEEEEGKAAQLTDYIFEPNIEEIITELVPRTLKIQLFKAILESNASEHGARMTAMDKATENATELLKELQLSYNQTRQAAITKEILEIVGGAEALRGD